MAPTPIPPSALVASAVTPFQARLDWTEGSAVERWIYLERAIGMGAFQHEATLPANRKVYVASELASGTVYQFRARARNDAGWSTYSNSVMLRTPPRLLAPQDLTYLGQMKVPEGVSAFGGGALTGRTVNGQVSLFLCGHAYQGGAIYEFPYMGHHLDVTQAPRSVASTFWGDVYQGRKISWNAAGAVRNAETTGSPWTTHSLLYHEDALYWTYADPYNGESLNDACLGRTRLDTSPVTVEGPWRFDSANGAHSQQCSRMVISLPDGRIAVGGGHTSIAATAAWGPTLRALPVPAATMPTGATTTPLVTSTLLAHDMAPYGPGQLAHGVIQPGAIIHRKARTANYSADIFNDPDCPDIEPTLNGGRGYFTQIDDVTGAISIDLPEVHGLLMFGSLGTGKIWYGDGSSASRGENADGFEPIAWIYDPADCADVEAGRIPAHAVPPLHTFNPRSLANAANLRLNQKCNLWGTYLDVASRLLFVCAPSADPTYPQQPLPLVHVFQVAA